MVEAAAADRPLKPADWASLPDDKLLEVRMCDLGVTIEGTDLEDVLACPCGGRRRLVADISEREVIVAIVEHLGLPSEAPPIARARSRSCEAA